MSGWLDELPWPTGEFLRLAGESGDSDSKGIDEPSLIKAGDLPQDGLAAVYDPAAASSLDSSSWGAEADTLTWERWQQYAAQRGRAMSTFGDIFDFMTELGLLERLESDDGVQWCAPAHLPLAKDVLNLGPEQADERARGRRIFELLPIQLKIISWLRNQRSANAVLRTEVSIASLAQELDLDHAVVRHALRGLAVIAPAVQLSSDPEIIEVSDTLTIVVDWEHFDATTLI